MPDRRYPLQPLLDAARVSLSALNTRVRMNAESYRSARERGLTPRMADKWASLCGLHPANVWPSWIADEEADLSRPCGECGEPFLPGRSDAIFCSQLCGNRKRGREYLARKRQDPEFRAAEAKRVAAWRRDCPGYVALDNKRRRARAKGRPTSDAKRAGNRRYYVRHRDEILARKRAQRTAA